jgi:hypothetical protein
MVQYIKNLKIDDSLVYFYKCKYTCFSFYQNTFKKEVYLQDNTICFFLHKVHKWAHNGAIVNSIHIVRFQVLIEVSIHMAAFWDVVQCSLVEADQHFRGAYCLHHHPDDEVSKHLWNAGLLLWNYTAPYTW